MKNKNISKLINKDFFNKYLKKFTKNLGFIHDEIELESEYNPNSKNNFHTFKFEANKHQENNYINFHILNNVKFKNNILILLFKNIRNDLTLIDELTETIYSGRKYIYKLKKGHYVLKIIFIKQLPIKYRINLKLPSKERILYMYNEKYEKYLNDLIKLRERQNFIVLKLKCNNNDSYDKLKNIVNNIYENEKIKYLVLIGDSNEIKTLKKNSLNNSTYYHTLNNNIDYANSDISYGIINKTYKIIVGRISSINKCISQSKKKLNIKNQINKIIEYEEMFDNIDIKKEKWIKNIIGISNDNKTILGTNGVLENIFMKRQLERYSRNLNCTYATLSQNNSLNYYKNNILEKKIDKPTIKDFNRYIDNGISTLFNMGYTDAIELFGKKYINLNVKKLSNNKKYFLGCFIGCSSFLDITRNSLINELQTTRNKGTIGCFFSSVTQSWNAPIDLFKQINTNIIDSEEILTIGELFKKSVSIPEFIPEDLGGNNIYPDFYYYNIYGDPSTRYILTKK